MNHPVIEEAAGERRQAAQQDLGTVLRLHRLLAGWTQEELAERARISTRAVVYLERGLRRPRVATLQRLADTLGITSAEQVQLARLAAAQRRRGRASG